MNTLVDVEQYVAATAGLYKKNGDPMKGPAVAAHVREYAETILPGILIDRRDPVVTRAQGEDNQ